MTKKIYLSVAAPVFNEEKNIEQVIRYWNGILDSAAFISEIVVTNDGSTDKTLSILTRLKKEIPRLKIVNHEKNCGYGQALTSAIRNTSGELIVMLDSDGQFDLKEYELLLNKAVKEKLDGVTGFRKKKKDTIMRVLLDRILNLIIRIFFHIQFRDTNCALKLIKGDIIRRIDLEAKGYPTPTEIVVKLSTIGARLGEVGITHTEREAGISKLKPFKTAVNFLRFLLYLKLKVLLYNKNIIYKL